MPDKSSAAEREALVKIVAEGSGAGNFKLGRRASKMVKIAQDALLSATPGEECEPVIVLPYWWPGDECELSIDDAEFGMREHRKRPPTPTDEAADRELLAEEMAAYDVTRLAKQYPNIITMALAALSRKSRVVVYRDAVIYSGFVGVLTQLAFRAHCNNNETWLESFYRHERQQSPLYKSCRELAVEVDDGLKKSFTPEHQEWLLKSAAPQSPANEETKP